MKTICGGSYDGVNAIVVLVFKPIESVSAKQRGLPDRNRFFPDPYLNQFLLYVAKVFWLNAVDSPGLAHEELRSV